MQQATMEHNTVGETMVEFLGGVAGRYGPRTALLFKPGFRYLKWSYSDLWEGSGQVATLLQKRGLTKGDRVLIWGPNCPQWVMAFFGCLRAGVVVVPLDLRCSTEFAENVASQTAPKLSFISRVTPDAHLALGVPEVSFEELEGLLSGLPAPEQVEVGPEDLAEVMFTSGTTGDPKGVMLTHRNLTSNIHGASQHMPGDPSDRLMSVLPLSHMFEQLGGLFLALRAGANVTFPTSRRPKVLAKTMQDRRVTMLLLVPQVLELLMNGIEREVSRQGRERLWRTLLRAASRAPYPVRRLLFRSVHKKFGGELKLIVTGGAALDPGLASKWELMGVNVTQGYGATEASPVISIHTQDRPRHESVGPPLPDMEVRITDSGEVQLRGPSITGGYWKAPEKTADSFEDGWYKTGDQGFLDEQGFLHLKGRTKDMIVLSSGENVFPEDIEAVLKKHDAIKEVAVVGLPQGASDEVHAALLMYDDEQAAAAVSWANGQLGEHQQIRGHTVWPSDEFPMTHTLKVKKGQVIDILKAMSSGAAAPGAAVQGEEEADGAPNVRRLVAEVTGFPIEELTPEKTLGGDLGLDSLGRVELLSAIEEEMEVYIDESAIGMETTVAQLAEMTEKGGDAAAPASYPQWGMSWWCTNLRDALQRAIVFPLLRLTNRYRVVGADGVKDIAGPMLFTANHCLFLDNGLLIKAMPSRVRRRLAIAAWDEPMRNPVWAILNPLLGNGFPFSKEGNIRASMDNLGSILDRGWNVLIYPEGTLTIGGPTQPFQTGTALVAVEGKVPVVPLRVDVRKLGSPRLITFWKRSDVEIRFGKPISFAPGTDHTLATNEIEAAVKAL